MKVGFEKYTLEAARYRNLKSRRSRGLDIAKCIIFVVSALAPGVASSSLCTSDETKQNRHPQTQTNANQIMFSLYHLPALYFAFSHTGGPLMNSKKAMILYVTVSDC